MKKTYLSLDLDYWDDQSQRHDCSKIIQKVLDLGVPITVVLSHEDLLEDVNNSGCVRVEHVDYHSDVVDLPSGSKKKFHFNEGSWLSFVKWRQCGELVWRYPNFYECYRQGWGLCHNTHNPFTKPVSGWKHIRRQQGLDSLPWKSITRAGISISFEYWNDKEGLLYEDVLSSMLGTRTHAQAIKILNRVAYLPGLCKSRKAQKKFFDRRVNAFKVYPIIWKA